MKQYLESFNGSSSELDDILEEIEKKDFKTVLKLPKYLTHCTYHHFEILKEQQFGGKKVLSGNVEAKFPETHFSPVPMMTPNLMHCLIFDTEKLKKRNPDKKIRPTFYSVRKTMDKLDYLVYFDDDGWQKMKRNDVIKIEKAYEYAGSPAHKHEREWNMENVIKFDWEDVEGFISSVNWVVERSNMIDLLLGFDNPITLKNYKRIRNNTYYTNRDKYEKVDMTYKKEVIKPFNTVIKCEADSWGTSQETMLKDLKLTGIKDFIETRDETKLIDYGLNKCVILTENETIKWEKPVK